MYMSMRKLLPTVCVSGLLVPGVALTHHSGAMCESEKTVTLNGTVMQFEYVNPHAWLAAAILGKACHEHVRGERSSRAEYLSLSKNEDAMSPSADQPLGRAATCYQLPSYPRL
jgi:hypothetical protein